LLGSAVEVGGVAGKGGSIQPSVDTQALMVTSGSRVCAIPLDHVVETMRPLPIETLAEAPAFVRGVSVIRGEPTPVIDLRALLGVGGETIDAGRLVTVKVGERRLALGVDTVIGLKRLAPAQLRALPPLLGGLAAGAIEALGASDDQLLLLLRAARIVPEETWAMLAGQAGGR
jgi:purine-binding chemotaxis protein CheW